jgi:glucose-1-phosphate cytidylyltransferase
MRGSEVELPKPLVEIGGRPILWHVMALYAAHGLTDFVLLLGHGADQVRAFAESLDEPWTVNCLDTGLETPTGGRVARAAEVLSGGGTFCVTYADGVADIALEELLAFHKAHGGLATMTVVQPFNQWGVAHLGDGGRITGFEEKPRLDCWINGGFMVMEPGALEMIGENDILEREPFDRLAAQGDLYAYQHTGFWDCMDTYKDNLLLNELWDAGRAPWRGMVEA